MWSPNWDAAAMTYGKGGGGCGGGGADQRKEPLVTRVKEYQRLGGGFAAAWHGYCNTHGTTNFDPNRHEADFLEGFMTAVDAGEILPDENAAAQRKGSGKDWGSSGGKGGGGGMDMLWGGPWAGWGGEDWSGYGGWGMMPWGPPMGCGGGYGPCGKGEGKSFLGGKPGKSSPDGFSGGGCGGKPGDWVCPCGNVNFSYRDKCNKCGANNKGISRIGTKPGDWICPNCGDLVFASKDKCKMCGTPKSVDAPDASASGAAFAGTGADMSALINQAFAAAGRESPY